MFDSRAIAATIALWLFAGVWIGLHLLYTGARDPGLRLPDLTTTDRQPN